MLKVAIVGAGNMARCHMDVAAHLNDVEIVKRLDEKLKFLGLLLEG